MERHNQSAYAVLVVSPPGGGGRAAGGSEAYEPGGAGARSGSPALHIRANVKILRNLELPKRAFARAWGAR